MYSGSTALGKFAHEEDHMRLAGLNFPTSGSWINRPSSPSVGSRHFDVARGLEFYWDGTRWLTTELFNLPFTPYGGAMPYVQSTQQAGLSIPRYESGNGVYLDAIDWGFYTYSAAQSAINYYTLSLTWFNTAGGSGAVTLGGTTDTKTFSSSGRWYPGWRATIGAALAGVDKPVVQVQMTPSGTPGQFYFIPTLAYRLIG